MAALVPRLHWLRRRRNDPARRANVAHPHGATIAVAEAAGLRKLRAARAPWHWRLLQVAVVGFLLVATAVSIAYSVLTSPTRLRSEILAVMRDNLKGDVQLDEARFTLTEGLRLRGIRVFSIPEAPGFPSYKIIDIPELQVVPDWGEMLDALLQFRPKPAFQAITLNQPSFFLRFNESGEFIDEDVFPKQKPDATGDGPDIKLPPIRVQRASLRWIHPQIFSEGEHAIDNVTIELAPDREAGWLRLTALAEGEPWGRFSAGGRVHVETLEAQISLVNRHLVLNDPTMAHVGPQIRKAFDEFTAVQDVATIADSPNAHELVTGEAAPKAAGVGPGVVAELRARLHAVPGQPAGFAIDVYILDGIIAYEQFPVPVDQVVGVIHLTNFRADTDPGVVEMIAFDGDNAPVPDRTGAMWVKVVLRGKYGTGDVRLEALVTGINTEFTREHITVYCDEVLVDYRFVAAIQRAPKTPQDVKNVFDMFRPGGVADAVFVVGPGTRPRLHLTLKDVNARLQQFPVPVFRASGSVEGWDSNWSATNAKLLPHTGAGPLALEMPHPTQPFPEGGLRVQLSVTSPEVVLTDDLMGAVPPAIREIAQQFGLEGRAEVTTTQVETQATGDVDIRLDIRPIALRASWNALPFPVEAVGGHVQVFNQTVRFTDVKARHGAAEFTLNGRVFPSSDGSGTEFNLILAAQNLALDADFWHAIEAERPPGVTGPDLSVMTAIREMFLPTGLVDVRFHMSNAGGHFNFDVHVYLHHATAQYEGFPLPLTDVSGHANILMQGTRMHVLLRNFTGQFRRATLHLDGTLQSDTASDAPMEIALNVGVRNVWLSPEIQAAFAHFEDQTWRLKRDPDTGEILTDDHGEPLTTGKRLWDMLEPTGTLDVNLNLMPAADPASPRTAVVRLSLRGVTLTYEAFPFRLEHLHGDVTVDGGIVTVTNITGRHGHATIFVPEGTISPRGYQMRVLVRDATFNTDLRNSLPPTWHGLFDALEPAGKFSLAIFLEGRIAGDKMWVDYDAELRALDNDFTVGLRVEKLRGHLSLRGHVTPEGHQAHGRMRVDEAQWLRMKIHAATIDMQYDNGLLKIPNLLAFAYGGFVEGHFDMDTSPGGTYGGYFRVTDLDIARWLREVYPGSAKLGGRFNAELRMAGRLARNGESSGQFGGRGKFDIAEGTIFDVPLVLKLFDFANWDKPTPIDEVHGVFTMDGNGFDFSRLDLISDAVGMYGKGQIGFDSMMNMTFVLDFAPRVVLPDPVRALVQLLERSLLPVYVTGALNDPTISAVFPEASEGPTDERPR